MNLLKKASVLALISLLLAGCLGSPLALGGQISVWVSPSLQLWGADAAEKCASKLGLRLNHVASPEEADVSITWGTAPDGMGYRYQIGSGDLSIISNDPSLSGVTPAQIGDWFILGNGPGVVAYPLGDDITRAFAEKLLAGAAITSSAKLALDHQQMIVAVMEAGPHVGMLPSALVTNQFTELFKLTDLPILASSKAQPADAAQNYLACLQEK